ncbi:MAG: adenylate/guanylate cyclase domain-containing protein, partial [Pseudomonadota bacterium]
RIGLHGGPIVISQCGDQKQEISYFGDTINTASRVVDACKTYGRGLLISGDLLSRIALPDRFRSTLLGTVQLRGHARETDLLGVELV